MRELDVVLTRYLETEYPGADSAQRAAFVQLLDCQDPEIFAWLTGRDEPRDAALRKLVATLRGTD